MRIGDPVGDLRRLSRGNERLWVVVPSGRDGKPDDLGHWLGRHCSQQLLVRHKRYDYYDNVMEVFLFTPENGAPQAGDGFAANQPR
jgi:hypothetical protein